MAKHIIKTVSGDFFYFDDTRYSSWHVAIQSAISNGYLLAVVDSEEKTCYISGWQIESVWPLR